MRDLSPDDRPREKLWRHGVSSLGDNELVALVVGQGGRHGGALVVANDVLARHGGLHGLVRCAPGDLARVAGIGQARAAQIVAAVELGRRTLIATPGERARLNTPRDAAEYLIPRFGAQAAEHFGLALLDAKHRLMRTAIVVAGTANSTLVEPRDVFREAALGGATAIIVFHNHPSGDPEPSAEDRALTRRLVAAGVLMGIDLVDHIIVTDRTYWSFQEAGAL